MGRLVACPGCSTHVGAGERTCPFCGQALRAADGSIAQTTAAVMLGLSVGGIACSSPTPVYGVAEGVSVTSGASPTGGPPCNDASPIPPGGPFPTPAEAQAMCTQAGEPLDPLDAPGIRAWLPGRWFFCGGQPIFFREALGLEFVSDGTWYFLEHVGAELVRGPQGGNWFANGPACTPSGIELARPDQTSLYSAEFSVAPVKLELLQSGFSTEYLAIGEGPVGQGGAGGAGGAR